MGRQFISWRRVSTDRQNKSGLGLEAQKSIIDYFVNLEQGTLIADYEECHTGTSLATCTELKKAMEHCKRVRAILIIAKSDRLRNTMEALQILDFMGEGNIMFCDLPVSDRFSLTLYTALAEREALLIKLRTKAALEAKRQRGEQMGGTNELWGKNTGADREQALSKAHKASARARRERMASEPSNKFFLSYILSQSKHGRTFDDKGDFTQLADELNMLGMKTPTGMAYDKKRAQSQYIKLANAGLFNTHTRQL